MAGLDAMLQKIADNSKRQCDIIISNAKREADAMLSEARKKGEKAAAAIIEKAHAQADATLQRANSAARAYKSRALLATKVAIISEVQSLAIEHLKSLPDTEYADVIKKLAIRFASPGDGELCLSTADASRLPEGFEADLNAILKQKGASLRLKIRNQASGGFILVYGDIEHNCTFEALLEDKREQLKDSINRELFA